MELGQEEHTSSIWRKPVRCLIHKYITPTKEKGRRGLTLIGKPVPQDLFRWRMWLEDRGYDLWSPLCFAFLDYIKEISEGESSTLGQIVTVKNCLHKELIGITGTVDKLGEGGVWVRHVIRRDNDIITFFYNKELV